MHNLQSYAWKVIKHAKSKIVTEAVLHLFPVGCFREIFSGIISEKTKRFIHSLYFTVLVSKIAIICFS